MSRWRNNSSAESSEDQGRGRWHAKPDFVKDKEDKAYDQFAEMMIKKLEEFTGDWQKPWFNTGLAWPKALYGKKYNGMNALMLSFLCEEKGYQVPVFATHPRIGSLNFTEDKDGNRVPAVDPKTGEKLPFVHILKGESAFPVFLSQTNVVHKETKERIPYSDYVKLTSEEQEKYNVYHNNKVYPVFNVDQTNLKEARPELYQKLVEENAPKQLADEGKMFAFEPIDKMISDNLWVCPIKPTQGDRAFYSPSKDEIVVPVKGQFDDGAAFYGTLLHEMVHSTGHQDRLKRLEGGITFGDAKYSREELVAELGKAITCQRYGIEAHLKEDTLPYLKGWLQSLHEEPKYIKTVLNDVKQASGMIAVHIEEIAAKLDENKKLDGREVDDEEVSIDDEGNTVVTESEHLDPDKKQGEDENSSKEETETEQHKRVFHR